MTVGIIGLGLIGASYAAGLKAAGHTVFGYDRQKEVMDQAFSDKLIEGDCLERMSECEIIILCLLPDANVEFVRTHAAMFSPGQIVSDVAGVKSSMMASIESALPEGVAYLSHHPMAGNPEGGYANHDAHLFEGANAILVEGILSNEASFSVLRNLLKALGMRKTVRMNASTHDAFIAHTSQLTHLISSALVLSAPADMTGEVSGNSYRDLTRIGDIEPDLWTPLFLDNKDALLDTLKIFQDTLDQYREALESGDDEGIHALLETTRRSWRKRNG